MEVFAFDACDARRQAQQPAEVQAFPSSPPSSSPPWQPPRRGTPAKDTDGDTSMSSPTAARAFWTAWDTNTSSIPSKPAIEAALAAFNVDGTLIAHAAEGATDVGTPFVEGGPEPELGADSLAAADGLQQATSAQLEEVVPAAISAPHQCDAAAPAKRKRRTNRRTLTDPSTSP